MDYFHYNVRLLNDRHKDFMLKLLKFKNIGVGVPKVYFIVNKTTNQVLYIGSCKTDIYLRLKFHFNEAVEIVFTYDKLGTVRPMYNNHIKARTLCDLIYNLHEIDVVIFGEYETLENAELVEKALIYNSRSPYMFNICNYTSVDKLSTKAIKSNKL